MNIKVTLKRTIFFRWYCSYLEYRRKRHLDMMSALLKKEGAITLKMFADALNHAAIDFWIDYGTLLGYRRDNDFLEHDNDIDTGAFIEDADAIREVLTHSGFKLVRYYHTLDGEFREDCYCRIGTHLTIDVFYYRRIGNLLKGSCFSLHDKTIKIKYNLNKELPFQTILINTPFNGLKKVLFKETEVKIPINIDEYLLANYGPNFMIPDPDFSYKSAPNIQLLPYDEKPAIGYLEIPY